jgi:hypothetical protein
MSISVFGSLLSFVSTFWSKGKGYAAIQARLPRYHLRFSVTSRPSVIYFLKNCVHNRSISANEPLDSQSTQGFSDDFRGSPAYLLCKRLRFCP